MAYYIGIDLGTTNSAICSYDGMTTRIWKSPEQTDVTPSAIYIDKRGNRYYGQKACSQATYNPGNSATLFKRFLGTDKKIHFEDADITMSPEECSAEILRVLYGYLPDEIRSDPETATVITVPAAFGVMKKDATMEAARKAGIGRVALMQEPVAAVMSILKESPEDGLFLVYDLGGGTFDVSIAENIAGKVSLLANGGIEICGGRDIDRKMFDTIVMPWLRENFVLPEDLSEEKTVLAFEYFAEMDVTNGYFYFDSNASHNVSYETLPASTEWKKAYFDITEARQTWNWGAKASTLRWAISNNQSQTLQARYVRVISKAQMDAEGGTFTGISTISDDTAVKHTGIYTITGIRVEKPTRGLYIINGKKVLVK